MFIIFLLYCYYYSVMYVTVMPVSTYMALAFVFGFIQINWWWWWWWMWSQAMSLTCSAWGVWLNTDDCGVGVGEVSEGWYRRPGTEPGRVHRHAQETGPGSGPASDTRRPTPDILQCSRRQRRRHDSEGVDSLLPSTTFFAQCIVNVTLRFRYSIWATGQLQMLTYRTYLQCWKNSLAIFPAQ